MKRMTSNEYNPCFNCNFYSSCSHIRENFPVCPERARYDRFAAIEDILGDEYDLERLRVIMDAEQHGGLIVGYGPGDPGEPGEPGELGVMEEVAADNVVVVRCRECIYYKICDEWENGKRMLCEVHHHSYLDHDGDNHFCSWGQRKIETVLAKSDAKDESLEDDHMTAIDGMCCDCIHEGPWEAYAKEEQK